MVPLTGAQFSVLREYLETVEQCDWRLFHLGSEYTQCTGRGTLAAAALHPDWQVAQSIHPRHIVPAVGGGCKVILLFIFMPLIRVKLIEFRRQPKREYHVARAPDELYEDQENQEKQCGFAVNQEALNGWKSMVTALGKLTSFAHRFFSVANHLYNSETDFNSYLTIETMQWREQTLQLLGHDCLIAACEFFTNGKEVIPTLVPTSTVPCGCTRSLASIPDAQFSSATLHSQWRR